MTKVTRDQFVWDKDRLIHKPTGASFNRRSQIVNYQRAGEVLSDGTCYDRADVYSVANNLVYEANNSA